MASRWTPALAAALAGCTLLAVPTIAAAEVDPDSLFDRAEVVATAFDGGGGSEVRDRSGRIGFTEFTRTVRARDRNSDSGRAGKGDALQDTRIVEDGDELLGVDSSGIATADFTDPNTGDIFVPFGQGTSELDVEFEVTGAPVKFSLTGSLEASAPSTNATGTCGATAAVNFGGDIVQVNSGDVCGAPSSDDFEMTGTLDPQTHGLTVDLGALASGGGSSGPAMAAYDIKLRFCTIIVPEANAITLGGSGDNVICGTSGVDEIHGQSGADRIFGLGGDDTLTGGPGPDKIDGGDGAEVQIYGGRGNDEIDAGPGDDGPVGVPAEVVAGGPGDDQIDGGAGEDRILGRCGETLLGDFGMCPGDPVTPGESDDDNLVGGLGDDFLFGDAGPDLILGGGGFDFANGDAGADTLVGGTVGDSLDGGEGADELFGEGGTDALFGAAGGDCLVGGASRDELFGGADDDKLLAKDGSKDTGNGGAGPDRGRFDPVDAVASVSNRNFQGGC